ncbi:MAG: serine hydrolase [Pseudomonadota bacterium]
MLRWIYRLTKASCCCALLLGANAMADMSLEQWANQTVSEGDALSVSVLTHLDGKAGYLSAGKTHPDEGAPGPDTQYEIGSITKVFTNLLLAEMVATGAVSDDTTIGDIFGDEIAPLNPDVQKITLLELATHTSGLPRLPVNMMFSNAADPYAGYDAEKLKGGINLTRALQPLIKRYAYSNFGVGLLGHALGRVDGEGYRSALKRRILDPLGLEHAAFVIGEDRAVGWRGGEVVPNWTMTDALTAAGGLRASASDLGRFGEIMRGAEPWPLKQDREAGRKILADAGDFDVSRIWHVARAESTPIYWHNGGTGGYYSFFGFRPDNGATIAILVAGGEDPTATGLDWLGRTAAEKKTTPPDATVIGQYQFNPSVGLAVFETDGELVAQMSGQGPVGLLPGADDWYAFTSVDASLRFVREAGEVIAVELAQNQRIQRAGRTSDQPSRPTRTAIELSAEALSAFVGEYPINDSVKFTIKQGDDGLLAQLTGQAFYPIYPSGDDVFFYRVVDAELRFERDDADAVTALTLHQGPVQQRAKKQR